MDRVRNEKFVFMSTVTHLSLLVDRDDNCDLTVSSERFFKTYDSFATYKGFPYLDMFNARQVNFITIF